MKHEISDHATKYILCSCGEMFYGANKNRDMEEHMKHEDMSSSELLDELLSHCDGYYRDSDAEIAKILFSKLEQGKEAIAKLILIKFSDCNDRNCGECSVCLSRK